MTQNTEAPEVQLLTRAIALAIEAGIALGQTPEQIAARLAHDVVDALKKDSK